MFDWIFSFFGCRRHGPGNTLYAFDFDQTIVAFDSEVAISSILKSKIPQRIIEYYNGGNWAAYCQMLIDHVILTDGVSLEEIIQSVKRLELTPGMDQLLHKVQARVEKHRKSRFIIISGSNDLFVECVLSNLDPPIQPNAIISNSATRTKQGTGEPRLIFRAHHDQRNCRKCPRNMCKGTALELFIEQNGPFETIYYVGDGTNDVCPALKLTDRDVLFVRKNHALETVIANGYFVDSRVDISAKIYYWETGEDIEAHMKL